MVGPKGGASHPGPPKYATGWMKCQPKCQKCEQNVFLRVMPIKQSYRIR